MAVEIEELLTSVTSTARAVFAAASCSIALLDADGAHLEFRAASGVGAEAVVGLRITSMTGIAGWAVTSGQALAVADVASDARFARDTAEEIGYVPNVIMAAPVIHEGEAVGVIEVLDPGVGPERERDIGLLGHFADHLAMLLAAFRPPPPGAMGAAEEALLRAALDYARERGP